MIPIARDRLVLQRVTALLDHNGWKALREEALKKVASHEDSISRLIFRTRTDVDEKEIEYYRGFRQGVMYVIDGLPNQIKAEFDKGLKESDA